MGRWEEFPLQTNTAFISFPLPVALHGSIEFVKPNMLKNFKISQVLRDMQISVSFLCLCAYLQVESCGKPSVSSSLEVL